MDDLVSNQPANEKRPLVIQLEVEFLDRLKQTVLAGRAASVSEVIRDALEGFDFANFFVIEPAKTMMSVRLDERIRTSLQEVAESRQCSVGRIVRTAVEAYLPTLEKDLPEAEPAPRAKKSRKAGGIAAAHDERVARARQLAAAKPLPAPKKPAAAKAKPPRTKPAAPAKPARGAKKPKAALAPAPVARPKTPAKRTAAKSAPKRIRR